MPSEWGAGPVVGPLLLEHGQFGSFTALMAAGEFREDERDSIGWFWDGFSAAGFNFESGFRVHSTRYRGHKDKLRGGRSMSQLVAEYLGVRVQAGTALPLLNSEAKPKIGCPFRNDTCVKAGKGQVPVCSIRDAKNGQLFIVCEHRLCASSRKTSLLSDYQGEIIQHLMESVLPQEHRVGVLVVQREARVRRQPGANQRDDSKADFLVTYLDVESKTPVLGAPRFLVEMQGGGETSDTRNMTSLVQQWEKLGDPDPAFLIENPADISPIETNAWRRQQEQFLFKGNVITRSNGRMIFAMGARLYDKVLGNLSSLPTAIRNDGGWNLALVGFVESDPGIGTGDSLGLAVDPDRMLLTDYNAFAQRLMDQGSFDPELFSGQFYSMNNQQFVI